MLLPGALMLLPVFGLSQFVVFADMAFPDDIVLPRKLVPNLRTLGQRLAARNYPSLHVKTAFIPDGRHISVFPAAVGFGLIELFGL